MLSAGLCWYLPLCNPFSGCSRDFWTHSILSFPPDFPKLDSSLLWLPFRFQMCMPHSAVLSGLWFVHMRLVEGPLHVSAELLMPTHPAKEFLPYCFIPPFCDWDNGWLLTRAIGKLVFPACSGIKSLWRRMLLFLGC